MLPPFIGGCALCKPRWCAGVGEVLTPQRNLLLSLQNQSFQDAFPGDIACHQGSIDAARHLIRRDRGMWSREWGPRACPWARWGKGIDFVQTYFLYQHFTRTGTRPRTTTPHPPVPTNGKEVIFPRRASY